MIKCRKIIYCLVPLSGFLLALIMPETVSDSVRAGLMLCGKTLIPSLFPYMILSSLLVQLLSNNTRSGKTNFICRTFGISGCGGSALLIGCLAGYPSGAKTIADLYRSGAIKKQEAERLLSFSCNAGPAFIFGMIGALYHSLYVCIAILCIHLGSSILLGCITPGKVRFRGEDDMMEHEPQLPKLSDCLLRATASATDSLLKICGMVSLFSILMSLEKALLNNFSCLHLFLAAFTELTGGLQTIADANIGWSLKFSLTAAAVSFGGLCVITQTAAVLSDTDLKLGSYVKGKIAQAILSAILAWPISRLISPAVKTAAFTNVRVAISPLPWMIFSAVVYIVIFLKFPSSNLKDHRL